MSGSRAVAENKSFYVPAHWPGINDVEGAGPTAPPTLVDTIGLQDVQPVVRDVKSSGLTSSITRYPEAVVQLLGLPDVVDGPAGVLTRCPPDGAPRPVLPTLKVGLFLGRDYSSQQFDRRPILATR